MRDKLFCFATFLLTISALVSFTGSEEATDFPTLVHSQFNSFLDSYRQEKLYLHTDKPYYSAGENIWFKGYLVNAATLIPESLSGYIYVELINRNDSVLSRVKIQKGSTGFAGHIELDSRIPEGDYNLRAYSHWMQNVSADFFFKKNVYIGNWAEDRMSVQAYYDNLRVKYNIRRSNYAVNVQTSFGAVEDGNVLVDVRLTDESMIPIPNKKVKISGLKTGRNRNRDILLTTNQEGDISFDFPIDTVNPMPRELDLSLSIDEYNFETKLYIPDFSNDFDVQFFPESGLLLNNRGLQPIAFKAIGTDGLSREVSGKVYSQNDVELLEFETQINGMGKFNLNTVPGESYYAIVRSNKGVEKRFDLPKLEDEGITLHLNFIRDKIYYSITNQLPDQSLPLYLLIHSKGKPFVVSPINNLIGNISGLNTDAGIYTFSIVDSLGNVYCERLFFKNRTSPIAITMKSDKETYGKRELVNLSFQVQSILNQTPEGTFSLSVTDHHYVESDTINDNIVSNLLLSSDLKGNIEHPTSYFTGDSIVDHQNIDLLLLTQGWRRYNTSDILKNKLEMGKYYMELGQTLSGKVVNIFDRPVKDCEVLALANGTIISTQTDSLGQYVFDDIGFPDSTTFVLRAQRKRILTDVEIIPNVDVFPTPKGYFASKNIEQQSTINKYKDQMRLKDISEGGISHIHLDEITVRAQHRSINYNDNDFWNMADNVLSSEDIERMQSKSLRDILSALPGVIVAGERITIRNNPGPPLLMIDGFTSREFSDIERLTVSDIDNIQVFSGPSASFFGAGSSNGVLSFTTKRGGVFTAKRPISMATVTPLGVQKPVEFYVPKYDIQSVKDGVNPDLRTTIYWDPSLSTDSLGMVNVSFYTADPVNDYRVVLEGVTKEGEIGRFEGVIKRN